MPVIKNNIFIFKAKDILFEVEYFPLNIFSFKKFRHLHADIKQPIFCVKVPETTICIDLINNSETKIKNRFRENFRSDIKKAVQLEIKCISGNYLNEFYKLYLNLCSNKKLPALSKNNFESLNEYTYFSIALLNNEILCAHCHIFNEERNYTRLFASASNRFNDAKKSNIIGLANKLLTSEDIFHFKNQGFDTYDFGGYAPNTKDAQLDGINRFKKGFGGEIVELHSYSTLPYFILQQLSAFKSRINKKE